MASNNHSGPQSGDDALPNHVTVRVITLAHSDRTENDLYLLLNLDTTVGELKQRIQDGLSQRPPPETQRLLYHGRPLLDENAIFRQILRQEQISGNAGTSYVLHLVIRDTRDNQTQRSTTHSQMTGLPPPRVQMNNPQFGQIQVPQMPAGIPDFAHNMIHNSMHMMQHQRAVEEATRRARGIHSHVNPLANEEGSTAQTHPQGQMQTQTQIQSPQIGQPSSSPAQPPPSIQVTQTPQMLGLPMAEPPSRPVPNAPIPSVQTTRIQETIGPSGERIRTVVNNNSMMFQIAGNNLPNPFDRPSSAPGTSPPASSNPTNRHDGSAVPPLHFHPQPPMMPTGFPFPPGRQLPLPAPPIPSLAIPVFLNAAPSMTNSGHTMAWLLSSPQGPQGIVFAPGHGYFSSNAPSVTVLSQAPNRSLQPTPIVPSDATQPETQSSQPTQQQNVTPAGGQVHGNPPPPQPGTRPQPDFPGPARAGAPAQAQAQVAAQQPANNDNDLLQLLVNRGWLFLRLYMFVFIFSESGTWRRIIMLGSIIIFCLLPQQNPLSDMFNVMRRHFDRLIGPPQIPERQPANPTQRQNQQQLQRDQGERNNQQPIANVEATQAGNQLAANANIGRPMPTPEETARRLLAQHQDRRNAHPFLDLLYRIEQGAALFFASLVPGVGERHVRAREEARRIVEAEDRRLREESERQNQNGGENKTANASIEATTSATPAANVSSSGTGEASSSSVDPTGSSSQQQDLRSRNTAGGPAS